MESRRNSHFFTGKIKNAWIFKILAEGISKSFGINSIIRLKTKIFAGAVSLLKIPYASIANGRFFLRVSAIFKINMPQFYIRSKISVQAFMAQIIKQYQTLRIFSVHVITTYLKLVLQSTPIIRVKTRLVANPIVGQYTKLAQVDPMLLADIDSKTLEQTEAVIL